MATPVGDCTVFQSKMADDAAIRRENFRKLWGPEFSPGYVASRLWGRPSFWSDQYHGRKSFGEKLARKIEEHLGLPRLSLDSPAGVTALPRDPEPAGDALSDALDTVLDALSTLSVAQWRMARVRLDDIAGHPEMRDEVRDDLLMLLADRSGKQADAA